MSKIYLYCLSLKNTVDTRLITKITTITKIIFFSHRISVANSSYSQVIITEDSGSIIDIDYDWINKKLYWLDNVKCSIEVSEEDGTYRMTLITNLNNPTSFVIDPTPKYVFGHNIFIFILIYLDPSQLCLKGYYKFRLSVHHIV